MRCITAAIATLIAGPALAHPGHLTAGLAGHDHWIAGAAIGAAIVIGAVAVLKGWRRPDAADAEGETDETDSQGREV